jgi:hypothetical protein
MDAKFVGRLAALTQPWCPADFVAELLGVDVPGDPRLASAFRSWSTRFRGESQVERTRGGGPEVDRHNLETFLVQNGLISWKWAAAYLGMQTEALVEVADRLDGIGAPTQLRSTVSDQVARQREAALLFRAFPSLRGRTFSDHSRMCRTLHATIKSDLGIEVEPLICVTSAILDPQEPDIAAAFDAVTFDPVGLRYQVWLETKKPANLRPDVVSLKFYAKNEAELREQVMKGSEPDKIDMRLRAA